MTARPPKEAAAATGAGWDGERFVLSLLGRDYLVDPAAPSIKDKNQPERRVGFQAGMILLTTLAKAQDLPPSGRMVTPGELPGGRMFFSGPHALATPALEKRFGDDLPALERRAGEMGGRPWQGADGAVMVPGLPRIPLYVLVWQGDEEFPARAAMGIDDRAHFHLALDGIWALTNLLSKRLCERD